MHAFHLPNLSASVAATNLRCPALQVLGLKISKDDLITITLAIAISYGIRW